MKSTAFLLILLAGLNVLACGQLVGTWQCQSADGSSQDTFSKVAGGMLISSISDDGSTTSFVLDGAQHQSDLNGAQMMYTGTIACDDNGKGSMSLNAKVSVQNNQTVDLTIAAKFSVSGNQLTVDSSGTAGDHTSTGHSTCTRM